MPKNPEKKHGAELRDLAFNYANGDEPQEALR
jgi:hypothetical protein